MTDGGEAQRDAGGSGADSGMTNTVYPNPIEGTLAPTSLASGGSLQSLEGPFWDAQTKTLLFSDVVENDAQGARIVRYDPSDSSLNTVAYPGSPITTNGLAVDAQGRLYACERTQGAVARIDGGVRTALAKEFDSKPLSAPNDIVLRGDGNVYFSDPEWGTTHPGTKVAAYRIDPNGKVSRVFDLAQPNGIVLSADGRTLYIGSDTANEVWKLTLDAQGAVLETTSFIKASAVPQSKFKTPDGMCVDDAGNLYVANYDAQIHAIQVFDKAGKYLGALNFPDGSNVTNCSFGGADRRTLYVTTTKALFSVKLNVPGLP